LQAAAVLNRVGSCSTGKERDAESGNDYFMARYYNSAMGRFMSPDWSAKYEPVPYAKLDNPQTLNLYAYVGNNPLNRTDPTGHCVANPQAGGFTQGCGIEPIAGSTMKPFTLPKNPSDIDKDPRWSPDPKFDPHHRTRPGTRQWEDGDGNKLRFDPKDPNKKSSTEGGNDHYHYNGGKEHLEPGETVPVAEPEPPAPESEPEPVPNAEPSAMSQVGDFINDHKAAILAGAIVVGAVALAPETGGASLVILAVP
jgi:RHS repeat-associated protein